jgi:hypothetical protein
VASRSTSVSLVHGRTCLEELADARSSSVWPCGLVALWPWLQNALSAVERKDYIFPNVLGRTSRTERRVVCSTACREATLSAKNGPDAENPSKSRYSNKSVAAGFWGRTAHAEAPRPEPRYGTRYNERHFRERQTTPMQCRVSDRHVHWRGGEEAIWWRSRGMKHAL